jgi:ABC-type uncharacterized transport system ATPase subunit
MSTAGQRPRPDESGIARVRPNGAGKTTTIRVLTTLLTATAGRARSSGIIEVSFG